MSHRIDAGMQPVKAADLHPVLDRSFAQTQTAELLAPHYSMLPSRKLPDLRIARRLLSIAKPFQRPYGGS